jgi:hypothetical protein
LIGVMKRQSSSQWEKGYDSADYIWF